MTARIVIAALALAPLAAAATEKPKLSFVKDIVPIFTKSGCANSNCHGSIRGQAGFKLSLFGYEPDLDYDAIVKAQDGRRINRTDPAKSLILMKPTFGIPHGGGERFKAGSLEYEAILDWIKDGATYDSAGSPRLRTIRVTPEEVTLSPRYAWTVKLSNGMQVEIGRERNQYTLYDRCKRLTAAWGAVTQRWGKDIEYADLRYPNGFAIRAAGMRFITEPDKGKK